MPENIAQNQQEEKQSSQSEKSAARQGSGGTFLSPPPFQLKSGPETAPPVGQSAAQSAAAPIQRYADASDIVGNVSAGTSVRGHLSSESNRRIIERIAMLERHDGADAGEAYAALEPEAQETALREAISRFQESEQGQALIQQIQEDNTVEAGGRELYERPGTGALSRFSAPQATYNEGEMLNNDVTMQALANAWPKNFLGKIMDEVQAYNTIKSLVMHRSLPFNEANANVVSVRAFQGGEIHDNNEGESNGPFSQRNLYNDTTYILSQTEGQKHVTESRSTVDPGDGTSARSRRSTFQMEADQQWDYSGNSRITSKKYDRPMYGLADRTAVTRGRYWEEHPEELEEALDRAHEGARVVSDRNGRQFGDVNPAGESNLVSAIHSGGGGGGRGDLVGGDSTGCSVVHGAWFAHFNETLRRSTGGTDAVRFTYSLLDLRLFEQAELEKIVAEAMQ